MATGWGVITTATVETGPAAGTEGTTGTMVGCVQAAGPWVRVVITR